MGRVRVEGRLKRSVSALILCIILLATLAAAAKAAT